MHRCLEVPEIVQNILSFCRPRTLAALARSSKWFYALVVPTLWSSVDDRSFRHLLKVHPTAQSNSQLPADNTSKSSQFAFLANFVRSITAWAVLDDIRKIRPLLTKEYQDVPLFPGLQALDVGVYTPQDLQLLEVLTTSHLRSLRITFYDDEDSPIHYLQERGLSWRGVLSTILSRLQCGSQNLVSLRLMNAYDTVNPMFASVSIDTLLSFVRNVPQLKQFCLTQGYCNEALLSALSCLQQLEKTSICVAYPDSDLNFRVSLVETAFSSLTVLDLRADNTFICSLLEKLTSHLEVIAVSFETGDAPPSSTQLTSVTRAISRFKDTLISLALAVADTAESDPDSRGNPFISLHRCSKIQDFCLRWNTSLDLDGIVFDIDDDVYHTISLAWPHLGELCMIGPFDIGYRGLRSLAENSKSLQLLKFRRLKPPRNISEIPSDSPTQHIRIQVEEVLAEHASDTAGCLFGLWPNVEVLRIDAYPVRYRKGSLALDGALTIIREYVAQRTEDDDAESEGRGNSEFS